MPETLPKAYKPLLILGIMELYDYLDSSEILRSDKKSRKAGANLIEYALSFVEYDWKPDELFQSMLKKSGQYQKYDRFEIQYQLTGFFLKQTTEDKKDFSSKRLDILIHLPQKWQKTVDALKFCANIAPGNPEQKDLVQANFLKKNVIQLKKGVLADYLFDWRNSLYAYYYFHARTSDFIADLPNYTSYADLCAFSFGIYSRVFNKIYGLMTLIRLFQLFYPAENLFTSLKEAQELYNQAVFDRARKAFSIYLSENDSPQSLLLKEDQFEARHIFSLNNE